MKKIIFLYILITSVSALSNNANLSIDSQGTDICLISSYTDEPSCYLNQTLFLNGTADYNIKLIHKPAIKYSEKLNVTEFVQTIIFTPSIIIFSIFFILCSILMGGAFVLTVAIISSASIRGAIRTIKLPFSR